MKASRTLVKSTPELWAECSDAAALARHLGAFGEIRITKLEPETAVAWEGDDVRGTVTLEPSGWGTRVILTATPASGRAAGPAVEDPPSRDPEPRTPVPSEPAARAEPLDAIEPALEPAPPAVPEPAAVAEPEMVAEREPAPEPVAVAEPEPAAEPELVAEREPVAGPELLPAPRKPGLFARLFGRRGRPETAAEAPEPAAEMPASAAETPVAAAPVVTAEPEANEPEPGEPEPTASEVSADPAPVPPAGPAEALAGALDSLGRAHRRPFSHG